VPSISDRRADALLLGVAGVGMLVLGASGGVTALGDTLFPAGSLAEGLAQDLSPTAHILVRLRVFHPLIAVLVGGYTLVVAMLTGLSRAAPTRRVALVLVGLVIGQVVLGGLNVVLLAPVWMQLVHLLMADLVWITLVLLTVNVLTTSHSPDAQGVPANSPLA
jgi:heme A synthase